MRRPLFLLFAAVYAVAGCSRSPAEPGGGPTPSPPASTTPARVDTSTLVPPPVPSRKPMDPPPPLAIHWDEPSRWQKRVPSTPMRSAEWRIPHVASDREDAECFLITFGKGQGGSVDDNVSRWAKQFQDGATQDRTTRTEHGMTVTRVELSGTYTAMAMPGAAAAPARPGYRMVGEIVDAPSGLWFFKLTGPDATAKAGGKELDALVDSVRPN
jgi:hypothetical protein